VSAEFLTRVSSSCLRDEGAFREASRRASLGSRDACLL
jgi:hypothetical protein